MKATNNANEITRQWQQAVCGTGEARAHFLKRIMPKAAQRPR
jgi:hypothetical protein